MKKSLPTNKMLRRDQAWDYKQPAIYMLTLTLTERQPLLGRLIVPKDEGGEQLEQAYIERSAQGEMVIDSLLELQKNYAELQILQFQLMPDHLHVIVRVTQPMQQPLGDIVRVYKRQTEQRAKAICESLSGSVDVPGNHPTLALKWAPGFNDRHLSNKGQLQAMYDYIHDNPRRLALKRLNRELLRIRRGERYGGLSFDAVGNMELLQREKKAVHVRSRWTAEEKRTYKNGCILAARQGTVLVGPFISPDERAVLEVALREKLPVVYLQENGFPELYKPAGELIDCCAEGHLLLIAPWPYHSRRQTITREQCQLLNTMAERIAEER